MGRRGKGWTASHSSGFSLMVGIRNLRICGEIFQLFLFQILKISSLRYSSHIKFIHLKGIWILDFWLPVPHKRSHHSILTTSKSEKAEKPTPLGSIREERTQG